MSDDNRHVAFICSKGDLDMAYPALVMGWAALGNGIDVTIFFTFWGMDMINKERVDQLQIAPVGNTAMKMTMMGLKMEDFVDGVEAIVTAADFMDMTEGAQIIFI